jgi:peptide/nickel transport system permease protein
MSGSVPSPADPDVPSAAEAVEAVAPIDRTGQYLGPAGAAAVAAAAGATPARWRLLLRRPMFWVGAGILLFWVVCAVFGYLFAPYNPLTQQLLAVNAAPSAAHWFGTDPLGRDVLSRVITGARDILIITPLATILGTILGTALGLAMGYIGGKFDAVVARLVEAFLALPFVIVALLFVVAVGRSLVGITIIIALVFTPLIARTVRAAVQVERTQDYVSGSRLLGESPARVMFAEILPNVMPAIVVEFTVRLGYAVFAVATLSFLGFGIQPPTPDWGDDIASNYINLTAGYWWQTLFPALAIATLVTSVILIADSIEQVLAA